MQISLKAARINAGYTQDQVASKLEISRNTLISWEKGENRPKTMAVLALTSLYGVGVDDIFLPEEFAKSEECKEDT